LDSRQVRLGICFCDRHAADEWRTEQPGKNPKRFSGCFKNNVAGFAVGASAARDFVDPHTVALEIEHPHPAGRVTGGVSFLPDEERTLWIVAVELINLQSCSRL
jgi:hypothetical protein